MAPSSPENVKKTRPQSMLALNFSAALDEMFKLNGVGALELSVEEKKDEVQIQKLQLDDLESKLRETTERLKHLEANHRRNHSQIMMGGSGRPPTSVRPAIEEKEGEDQETDESGVDSGRSDDEKRRSQ